MFFVSSACARTGAASQAFERMHSTLSHRVKTEAPGCSCKAQLVYVFNWLRIHDESKAAFAMNIIRMPFPLRQVATTVTARGT